MYGIKANLLLPDKAIRHGARAMLVGGAGGAGWEQFQWEALSKRGRAIKKWATTKKFHNFPPGLDRG